MSLVDISVLEKHATQRSGYANKKAIKMRTISQYVIPPQEQKYYQKASNEGMAKHLGTDSNITKKFNHKCT